MAERRWDILRCNGCGALHDRPDAGCPECESVDYERVEVIPASDYQALRDAVAEEIKRLRDEANACRSESQVVADPDSYYAAAKRGNARGREIAADRLQVILDSDTRGGS